MGELETPIKPERETNGRKERKEREVTKKAETKERERREQGPAGQRCVRMALKRHKGIKKA